MLYARLFLVLPHIERLFKKRKPFYNLGMDPEAQSNTSHRPV